MSENKSPFTVTRTNHVGIIVHSLDGALAFWVGVMGFKADPTQEFGGSFLENVSGVSGARLHAAFLHAPGLDLEIIEYQNPKGGKLLSARQNDIGYTHLAFEVDDIEAAIAAAAPLGWKANATPQTIADGALKGTQVMYMVSPEGVTVELMQMPRP